MFFFHIEFIAKKNNEKSFIFGIKKYVYISEKIEYIYELNHKFSFFEISFKIILINSSIFIAI